MKKQILVIGDSLSLCREIRDGLQDDTTDVHYYTTTVEALDNFMRHHYCLAIMDTDLEGENELELIRVLRDGRLVPILALTSGVGSRDNIKFLDAGATVCMTKPLSRPEFIAQAHALVRLYMDFEHDEKRYYTLTFGTELIINPLCRQVVLNGTLLDLTRKEFDLLHLIASHPEQVFTRQQLYNCIWGDDRGFNVDESIRSHIKSLRKKLIISKKEYIQTVWGVGYRFSAGSK